ncbi:hypothetical protein BP5796_08183 [Coleophoma crateriformis]|uniref:Uncharacterized protein n=1 Tax=Coleophoma crateriformis TaxID=565419 RepID=A0A3D8RDM4_9HELO|nr:hypothetical protein BP5796_08183 [Coleophoma crateriformis]
MGSLHKQAELEVALQGFGDARLRSRMHGRPLSEVGRLHMCPRILISIINKFFPGSPKSFQTEKFAQIVLDGMADTGTKVHGKYVRYPSNIKSLPSRRSQDSGTSSFSSSQRATSLGTVELTNRYDNEQQSRSVRDLQNALAAANERVAKIEEANAEFAMLLKEKSRERRKLEESLDELIKETHILRQKRDEARSQSQSRRSPLSTALSNFRMPTIARPVLALEEDINRQVDEASTSSRIFAIPGDKHAHYTRSTESRSSHHSWDSGIGSSFPNQGASLRTVELNPAYDADQQRGSLRALQWELDAANDLIARLEKEKEELQDWDREGRKLEQTVDEWMMKNRSLSNASLLAQPLLGPQPMSLRNERLEKIFGVYSTDEADGLDDKCSAAEAFESPFSTALYHTVASDIEPEIKPSAYEKGQLKMIYPPLWTVKSPSQGLQGDFSPACLSTDGLRLLDTEPSDKLYEAPVDKFITSLADILPVDCITENEATSPVKPGQAESQLNAHENKLLDLVPSDRNTDDLQISTLKMQVIEKDHLPENKRHVLKLILADISPASPIITNIFTSIFAPKRNDVESENYRRLEWTCRCGMKSHEYFEEIQVGAVATLATALMSSGYVSHARISSHPQTHSALLRIYQRSTNVVGKARNKLRNLSGPVLPYSAPKSGTVQASSCTQAQTCRWLHVCLPKSLYATSLKPLHITCDARQQLITDATLFDSLRSTYYKQRNWRELLFFRLSRIDFIKFEALPDDLVDGLVPNEVPPPTQKDYDFVPTPPTIIPPISAKHMIHLFQNCHREPSNSDFYLQRIPKKMVQPLVFDPKRVDGNAGWGLNFVEVMDHSLAAKVMFVLSLVLGLGFGISWSIMEKDVSGGFGVAAYIVTVLTLAVVIWQSRAA